LACAALSAVSLTPSLLGDPLVEVLGQYVDLVLVFAVVGQELDLRQYLVGEGGAHHKARMAVGATQIDQPALGKGDQPLAVGEDDLVDLRQAASAAYCRRDCR
jgi:hypothetical protein